MKREQIMYSDKGMLIVIEGLDGSGKSTQVPLIIPALEKHGIEAKRISFPDYESKSSSLVKMYLAGEMGLDASAINAYAASSFYAVDRYASYHTKWKEDYESGKLIIAERYTSSNLIYQLSKVEKSQWDSYIQWANDFEHEKLGLPVPDLVIFLSVPLEISQGLLSKRYDNDEGKKDIHERNMKFLQDCSESAAYSAEKLGWETIRCTREGKLLSIDEIHVEIINKILDRLERR